ncbi:MAG: type II secretion system F family protein [Actinobacteria bacterium]|nr:type II secretion system F family protein [Actinomycetota bacterium]
MSVLPLFLLPTSLAVLFFRAYLHAARRERMATVMGGSGPSAAGARASRPRLSMPVVAALRGRARLMLLAGTGGFLAFVSRNPLLALLPFPAWRVVERSAQRRKRRKTSARREEQLPEFMDSLVQSLRSGLSLQQSLEASLEDVGEELREEITPVVRELRVGKGVEESLSAAARSSSSPSLRQILTVLALLHAKGGDLPRVLERMRRRVGEGLEARREINILTAQSRASGYLVSALPAVFLSLQAMLSPSSLRPLLATPLGNLLLSAGLGLNAAGFLIIRRLVDPEA